MRLKGVGLAMLLVLAMPASAQDAKVPYWASISSGEAMMRSGPGRTYPGTWLYKRRDLPAPAVLSGAEELLTHDRPLFRWNPTQEGYANRPSWPVGWWTPVIPAFPGCRSGHWR